MYFKTDERFIIFAGESNYGFAKILLTNYYAWFDPRNKLLLGIKDRGREI